MRSIQRLLLLPFGTGLLDGRQLHITAILQNVCNVVVHLFGLNAKMSLGLVLKGKSKLFSFHGHTNRSLVVASGKTHGVNAFCALCLLKEKVGCVRIVTPNDAFWLARV